MKRAFSLPGAAVCLCVFVMATAAVLAGSIEVRQSIVANNSGPVADGMVTVEIRNTTGASIRNVDLRLLQPHGDALPKGVIQFGSVDAGKTKAASTAIVLRATGDEPFLWQVDYDDATGHHAENVRGEQSNQ